MVHIRQRRLSAKSSFLTRNKSQLYPDKNEQDWNSDLHFTLARVFGSTGKEPKEQSNTIGTRVTPYYTPFIFDFLKNGLRNLDWVCKSIRMVEEGSKLAMLEQKEIESRAIKRLKFFMLLPSLHLIMDRNNRHFDLHWQWWHNLFFGQERPPNAAGENSKSNMLALG